MRIQSCLNTNIYALNTINRKISKTKEYGSHTWDMVQIRRSRKDEHRNLHVSIGAESLINLAHERTT